MGSLLYNLMVNFKCIAVEWYKILIAVAVVISILSLIVWLIMIIYISINGEYYMYSIEEPILMETL